jgi:hypothetical protein
MKRENAESLTKVFLQLNVDLNNILAASRDDSSEEDPDYLKLRGGVGQVLGTLYLDIMAKVFKEFPDLEPEDLRDADDDSDDDEDEDE